MLITSNEVFAQGLRSYEYNPNVKQDHSRTLCHLKSFPTLYKAQLSQSLEVFIYYLKIYHLPFSTLFSTPDEYINLLLLFNLFHRVRMWEQYLSRKKGSKTWDSGIRKDPYQLPKQPIVSTANI